VSIRRAPRPEAHFLTVRNDVCRDDRLTYRSLGLLVAMLSYPDNWQFATERLAKGEGREGEKAVRTALKELERSGYLVRHRTKAANGRFTWEHVLHDTPQNTQASDITAGQTIRQEIHAPQVVLPLHGPSDVSPREDQAAGDSWREQDKALFLHLIGTDTIKIAEDGQWTAGIYHTLALYGALTRRNRSRMKWPGRYLQAALDNEYSGYRDVDDWLDSEGIEAIHSKENAS
jgi:hypothetical protein